MKIRERKTNKFVVQASHTEIFFLKRGLACGKDDHDLAKLL